MKPFILLIFYAFVLCLAIFAGSYIFQEQGYVLLGYGKYYVEATALGFLLALLLLWLTLKLLGYVFRRVLGLGGMTSAFFSNRSRRKTDQAWRQGLTAFLCQDWTQAEKALVGAMDEGPFDPVKQLYAAVAADAMGDHDKALAHLSGLNDGESAVVRAELLLKQQALDEAAAIIEPLWQKQPKNPAVLGLYVKLLQARQDPAALVALLPQLEKHAGLSEPQWTVLSLDTVRHALSTAATEPLDNRGKAIDSLWKSLPGKMKKRHDMMAVHIGALATQGEWEKAETLLLKTLKTLKKSSVGDFLPLLQQPGFAHAVKLKAYVQSQLKQDEHNPDWLCALGYLALAAGDDVLAVKALGKVAEDEPQRIDLRLLADSYARAGEAASAIAIYQRLGN